MQRTTTNNYGFFLTEEDLEEQLSEEELEEQLSEEELEEPLKNTAATILLAEDTSEEIKKEKEKEETKEVPSNQVKKLNRNLHNPDAMKKTITSIGFEPKTNNKPTLNYAKTSSENESQQYNIIDLFDNPLFKKKSKWKEFSYILQYRKWLYKEIIELIQNEATELSNENKAFFIEFISRLKCDLAKKNNESNQDFFIRINNQNQTNFNKYYIGFTTPKPIPGLSTNEITLLNIIYNVLLQQAQFQSYLPVLIITNEIEAGLTLNINTTPGSINGIAISLTSQKLLLESQMCASNSAYFTLMQQLSEIRNSRDELNEKIKTTYDYTTLVTAKTNLREKIDAFNSQYSPYENLIKLLIKEITAYNFAIEELNKKKDSIKSLIDTLHDISISMTNPSILTALTNFILQFKKLVAPNNGADNKISLINKALVKTIDKDEVPTLKIIIMNMLNSVPKMKEIMFSYIPTKEKSWKILSDPDLTTKISDKMTLHNKMEQNYQTYLDKYKDLTELDTTPLLNTKEDTAAQQTALLSSNNALKEAEKKIVEISGVIALDTRIKNGTASFSEKHPIIKNMLIGAGIGLLVVAIIAVIGAFLFFSGGTAGLLVGALGIAIAAKLGIAGAIAATTGVAVGTTCLCAGLGARFGYNDDIEMKEMRNEIIAAQKPTANNENDSSSLSSTASTSLTLSDNSRTTSSQQAATESTTQVISESEAKPKQKASILNRAKNTVSNGLSRLYSFWPAPANKPSDNAQIEENNSGVRKEKEKEDAPTPK